MNAGFINAQEIYDFTKSADLSDWNIVDDVVMGGRSEGSMRRTDKGNAVFEGKVSLENNGGFSSVRYRPDAISASAYLYFLIRLKGDGKNYQFRVRSALNEFQSYVFEFETNGAWQVIKIPFAEMYPSYRGRKLDMPNYPGQQIMECSFLISNKKDETFSLELNRIWLEK